MHGRCQPCPAGLCSSARPGYKCVLGTSARCAAPRESCWSQDPAGALQTVQIHRTGHLSNRHRRNCLITVFRSNIRLTLTFWLHLEGSLVPRPALLLAAASTRINGCTAGEHRSVSCGWARSWSVTACGEAELEEGIRNLFLLSVPFLFLCVLF